MRSTLSFSNALETAGGVVELRSERELQFIDITPLVEERVRRSAVRSGLASVQSLHTTAVVIVNEDEPGLRADLARTLERVAPQGVRYQRDELHSRSDGGPDELASGKAHCRAFVLPTTAMLHVREGRLGLGLWQRVFFVELDGPRQRSLSILVIGSSDRAKMTLPARVRACRSGD